MRKPSLNLCFIHQHAPRPGEKAKVIQEIDTLDVSGIWCFCWCGGYVVDSGNDKVESRESLVVEEKEIDQMS